MSGTGRDLNFAADVVVVKRLLDVVPLDAGAVRRPRRSAGPGLAVVTFEGKPRHVERAALHVGVVYPWVDGDQGSVTLEDAEPLTRVDTAISDVAFSVCRLRDRRSALGFAHGSLTRLCQAVEPLVDGVALPRNSSTSEMLVMTITPTQAGMTRVDGVALTYSTDKAHLWRRGAETIGVRAQVRAR